MNISLINLDLIAFATFKGIFIMYNHIVINFDNVWITILLYYKICSLKFESFSLIFSSQNKLYIQ